MVTNHSNGYFLLVSSLKLDAYSFERVCHIVWVRMGVASILRWTLVVAMRKPTAPTRTP